VDVYISVLVDHNTTTLKESAMSSMTTDQSWTLALAAALAAPLKQAMASAKSGTASPTTPR
jgi:hypothetical protein